MTTEGRATRQRAAIRALLDKTSDFRSAQELHDELRQRGEGVGLTTVYRTLQQMATAGVLVVKPAAAAASNSSRAPGRKSTPADSMSASA